MYPSSGAMDEDTSPILAAAPPKSIPKLDVKAAAPKEEDQTVMSIVYCPGGILPKLLTYIGRSIEIRINNKYLTSKNKEVQTRQLWGTDFYTDDSDAVSILLHTGHVNLRPNPPGNGIAATFRVLSAEDRHSYPSTTRYNFKSRCWASKYPRTCLKLLSVTPVENANINSIYAIQPMKREDLTNAATIANSSGSGSGSGAAAAAVAGSGTGSSNGNATGVGATATAAGGGGSTNGSGSTAASAAAAAASSYLEGEEKKREVKLFKMPVSERALPHHSSKPGAAGGSGAAGGGGAGTANGKFGANTKRKVPDATIMFNSANEPCLKYSLSLMTDRGYIQESDWTSTRLRRECVYFEKQQSSGSGSGGESALPIRYELCREPESDARPFDTYRWSQVTVSPWANYELPPVFKQSTNKKRKSEPTLVPKPENELKILDKHLDWEQFEWGPASVRVRGKEYVLDTALWRPLYPPPPPPPPTSAPTSPTTPVAAAGTADKK